MPGTGTSTPIPREKKISKASTKNNVAEAARALKANEEVLDSTVALNEAVVALYQSLAAVAAVAGTISPSRSTSS